MRNGTNGNVFGGLAIISVIVISTLFGLGSRCNSDNEPMDTIRQVHSSARDAFHRADEFLAPRLESAGEVCESDVDAQELTGTEAYVAWQACMHDWMAAEFAMDVVRSSFAELENIYDDIDAGRVSDVSIDYILRRVLVHAEPIVHILQRAFEDNETAAGILSSVEAAVESLCSLIDCNQLQGNGDDNA